MHKKTHFNISKFWGFFFSIFRIVQMLLFSASCVFKTLFNHDRRHPSYLLLQQKIVVQSSGHVSHVWIHFLPLWVRPGVNCRHATSPTYWCGICELIPQIPQCSFWLDKPCGNDCFRCKADVHSVYPIKWHQSFEGCWKDTMMIFERNFFNTTNKQIKEKKKESE